MKSQEVSGKVTVFCLEKNRTAFTWYFLYSFCVFCKFAKFCSLCVCRCDFCI